MSGFEVVAVRSPTPGQAAKAYVGVAGLFRVGEQEVLIVAPDAIELDRICKRWHVDVDLLLSQRAAVVSPDVLTPTDDGL